VPEETTTRASLLARLADGSDPAAWGEFCSRYEDLILGFARRQGLQEADCRDVLQDVLLALTRAMPGFRYDPGRGRFRAYLKTVVLHAIFRSSRQKHGQVDLGELEAAVESAAGDAALDGQWEAQWRRCHLQRAMRLIEAEFNAADRAAFEAYALRGADARETAAGLGMSVEQVYQAKSRILRRLTALIEEQVREEDG
jgi:RNA polymerase sigma-70 factor (ECF subfamily)